VSVVIREAATVMTNAFRIVIGNPERKTLLGRLSCKVLMHASLFIGWLVGLTQLAFACE
jgi:hypothetical protein